MILPGFPVLLGAPAVEFPVVEATNTSVNDASVTTHTVSLPSGIQAGELLLIVVRCSGISSGPSGWSTAGSAAFDTFWWKIATGSEGSTVTFTTSAGTSSAHISARISGGVSAEVSSEATGSSTAPNPPSFSPSWGSTKTLWLAYASFANVSLTSYPSGYTGGVVSTGSVARNACAFRANKASSEDPGSFTLNGATGWRAWTLAIQPG